MARSFLAASVLAAILPSFIFGQAVPQFTISTVAGNGVAGFSGDGGPATSASFDTPLGAVLDAAGNIFVADFNYNRVRKITVDGTITTVAGTGAAGFAGDGGPATKALLWKPTRVTPDNTGNLYISDQFNNRIRKVAADGTITTVAGSTQQGYCGDGGPATKACLNGPLDVALDAGGNFYIAEFGSNVIRKVDTKGIISTVAGNGQQGYSGDGGSPVKAAPNNPGCVLITPTGDMLIADGGNARIRKVSNGIITTIIGNGVAGYSGDGGPATSAQISHSLCIRLDAAGNYYVPDPGNNHLRFVQNGAISTIAGNRSAAYNGDGQSATAASIKPDTISITPSGSIYASDEANNRIRLLTPVPQPPTINVSGVVPACSKSTSVQSGSWISIYGASLSQTTAVWNGDFPTNLAGVTVTIDGKPAYIWFVRPGQINAQVPDDSTLGTVAVVVTTPYGSSTSMVTLAQYSPCFSLFDSIHAAAIVSTTGPGNSGSGYDVIGPVGAFSFPTRPLVPGEIVTLFGIGFGATIPAVSAGQIVTAAAPSVATPQISIGGIPAQVLFAGIVEAGLFQFNVIVPNAPSGDQPLVATIGGAGTQSNIYVTVQ